MNLPPDRETILRPEVKVWSKETRPWITYADHLEDGIRRYRDALEARERAYDDLEKRAERYRGALRELLVAEADLRTTPDSVAAQSRAWEARDRAQGLLT